MFYITAADLAQRTALLEVLKQQQIGAVFHYVPFAFFLWCATLSLRGRRPFTTRESEKLIRLLLWYGIFKSRNHIYL